MLMLSYSCSTSVLNFSALVTFVYMGLHVCDSLRLLKSFCAELEGCSCFDYKGAHG